MSLIKSIFLSLLISFITLLPACQGKADEAHAPGFSLLNLSGDLVSLSDYRGKVVLINFFATYCPPCRVEMTDFVNLQKMYAKKGFTVIAISVDNEPQKMLPAFIERLGLNFPVLLATTKVLKDYGNIYALPSTFILDRDHKIVRKITGMVNQEEMEPVIKDLLFSAAS